MRTIDIKSLLITDDNIKALRDAKTTQEKINNTFIKFYKQDDSDSVQISAGELGIVESQLQVYTLEELLERMASSIIGDPCKCGSCEYVRFEIL